MSCSPFHIQCLRSLPLLSIFFNAFIAISQNFDPYQVAIPGAEDPLEMAPVSGGTFQMGSVSGEKDEQPVHKVKLDDFWISKYEVTWEQYEAFLYRDSLNEKFASEEKLNALGIDGVSGATQPYVDMSFGMGKKGYPAINITHHAALSFCKWLSAKTGHFYRLPTEAEWEYACRAGSETAYSFGEDVSRLGDYAWYKENSDQKYHQIGKKKANPWGIYDMHGNVAEWTMDQYQANYYSVSSTENPWLKPETLYSRVIRGGAWSDEASELRCTARQFSEAYWKMRDPQLPRSRWWHTNAPFVGFRVVRLRTLPSPKEIKNYWLTVIEDY